MKICHEILVLDLIRDCCSWQGVGWGSVQTADTPLSGNISGKESDEYAVNKIRGEIFYGFAVMGLSLLCHEEGMLLKKKIINIKIQ